MTKTAVITGAGSGVGRAIAVQMARDGWRLGHGGASSTVSHLQVFEAKPRVTVAHVEAPVAKNAL